MNADELVPRIAKALAARLGVDLDKADEIQVEKFLILADVAYIEVHKSGRLIPPESFYASLARQWEWQKIANQKSVATINVIEPSE